MARRERRIATALFILATCALVVALGYLLVRALDGDQLVRVRALDHLVLGATRRDPTPWLLVACLAAAASLAGWGWALRRAAALQGAERRAREEMREEVEDRERQLDDERARRGRLERSRETERRWNRELRQEVQRLHAQHSPLGDFGDVREMVLRLAVSLVEAEKGLLLSREDHDKDGDLDVVAAVGFDHDPADSRLAQRFASEVIERDTTVREDDGAVAGEDGSGADAEIDNLVAIPIYIRDAFHGVVVCANRRGGFEEVEEEVLLSLGDQAGAVLENSRLHGDLRNAYLATVEVLAEAIEAKDALTGGHSEMVAEYVSGVADRMGMDRKRREALIFGSLLHDVGKIGISERILLKPASLTDEERRIIQLHPRIGYEMLQHVPALRPIAPAVLHHHERYDGNGYPAGLRGEEIPLEARIVAVADSFSAMTGRRPYREPMDLEEACRELTRCAGTQFDPEVVRHFIDEVRRRPPEELEGTPILQDPEVDAHRSEGEFVLGSRAYGVVDSLTLLYSHRHLHEMAHAEAQRAELQQQPFSVVTVALTGLGELNRARGYGAGDEALRQAAAAVQQEALDGQGIACRDSGRRLTLLLRDSASERAQAAEQAIRQAVGEDLDIAIGSAVWQPGESGEDVLARARAAAAALSNGGR